MPGWSWCIMWPQSASCTSVKILEGCAAFCQILLARLEPAAHPLAVAPYPQHRRVDPPPAGERLVEAVQRGVDHLVRRIAGQDDFPGVQALCAQCGARKRAFSRVKTRVVLHQPFLDLFERGVRLEARAGRRFRPAISRSGWARRWQRCAAGRSPPAAPACECVPGARRHTARPRCRPCCGRPGSPARRARVAAAAHRGPRCSPGTSSLRRPTRDSPKPRQSGAITYQSRCKRVDQELERRRHVHPAVQQPQLRRRWLAPGAHVVAQTADVEDVRLAWFHRSTYSCPIRGSTSRCLRIGVPRYDRRALRRSGPFRSARAARAARRAAAPSLASR